MLNKRGSRFQVRRDPYICKSEPAMSLHDIFIDHGRPRHSDGKSVAGGEGLACDASRSDNLFSPKRTYVEL